MGSPAFQTRSFAQLAFLRFAWCQDSNVKFDLKHERDQKLFIERLRQEFGFSEERFQVPAPLGGEFFFSEFVQRKDAFENLLKQWEDVYNFEGDRGRAPIIALPAAPGTGKTRFAQVVGARGRGNGNHVEAEWKRAFENQRAGDFKNSIERAVAVTVTFNHNSPLSPIEIVGVGRHQFMIGVRMLYSHFCRDALFEEFFDWLLSCQSEKILPIRALELIRLDMKQNGLRYNDIILVVDEPFHSIEGIKDPERRAAALGTLCTSVGHIITRCKDVHILMTALSGPGPS